MRFYTTFNVSKLAGACGQPIGSGFGYDAMATYLGGTSVYGKDTPIDILTVLDATDVETALWCLAYASTSDSSVVCRRLAIECAKLAQPFYESVKPGDDRIASAIAAASGFLDGTTIEADMLTASAAAESARDENPGPENLSAYSAAASAAYAAGSSSAAAAMMSYSTAVDAISVKSYFDSSPQMATANMEATQNSVRDQVAAVMREMLA